MEPKQTREFAKLIREHFRLMADVRALASILETAVQQNQPPYGWLEALKLLRQSPDYRNISEQFDAQLSQIEQAADSTELERLIGSIPPTPFLN